MSEFSIDLISAYLDGECTSDEAAAVEARCASDPTWRFELESVRAARRAVRALPALDMPPEVADAVKRALAATPDADAPVAPVVPMRSQRLRWLWAIPGAALASAAALLVVVVAMPTPSNARPIRPSIAVLADAHNAHTASEPPVAQVASASLSNLPTPARGSR
ncbi:MAG: zf-HC2 domain-containing protein [Acidimicrobiia bacterium]